MPRCPSSSLPPQPRPWPWLQPSRQLHPSPTPTRPVFAQAAMGSLALSPNFGRSNLRWGPGLGRRIEANRRPITQEEPAEMHYPPRPPQKKQETSPTIVTQWPCSTATLPCNLLAGPSLRSSKGWWSERTGPTHSYATSPPPSHLKLPRAMRGCRSGLGPGCNWGYRPLPAPGKWGCRTGPSPPQDCTWGSHPAHVRGMWGCMSGS
mmetsp:Transcript_27109/g.43039  ORF Transcript_27109/g.43039 Transcript_27109/m.43039 type:complete len:206 (+) Transcript_27109:1601-2218(+)